MRVRVDGAPVTGKPVLILSNHISWLDIPVIGSTMPLVFISKSEVRNWPLVGPAAQLLHTIFVDRSRRQKTAEVNARIASKMSGGDPVVLFAEGTSSDGNRVLQFRSALVGAASDAVTQNKGDVWLQPMSISYPRIDGLPMGRAAPPARRLVRRHGFRAAPERLRACMAGSMRSSHSASRSRSTAATARAWSNRSKRPCAACGSRPCAATFRQKRPEIVEHFFLRQKPL